MYGLNPEINLSFLVGRELLQVCIGIHQVQLHFDKDVSISIEGQRPQEVAARLQVSIRTVENDLKLAKRRLRSPVPRREDYGVPERSVLSHHGV